MRIRNSGTGFVSGEAANWFAPRTLCCADNEGASGTGAAGQGATGSSSPATGGDAAPSGASGAPPSSSASQSTPSGTPSGQPAHTPPTADVGGDADAFNFDEIFRVTDPFGDPSLAAPPVVAPPPQVPPQVPNSATPPAAAQPPATPPAPEAPQTGAPGTAPQAGAAAPSQQVPPQALSPADPASIAQALAQNEELAIEHYAKEFALTPKELEALETDVYGALPSIHARLMVKMQQNFMRNLAQIVPAMMERHTTAAAASKEAESQFFSAWPKLNMATHGAIVTRTAKAYRALNPQASREQMIKEVGAMVMGMAGIPAGPAAAAPGMPANGVPVTAPRSAQPSPWQPAGAMVAQGSPPEADEWGFLGRHEE